MTVMLRYNFRLSHFLDILKSIKIIFGANLVCSVFYTQYHKNNMFISLIQTEVCKMCLMLQLF